MLKEQSTVQPDEAQHVHDLIAAANEARWQSWHGPESDRPAAAERADAALEALRRLGVSWGLGVGRG